MSATVHQLPAAGHDFTVDSGELPNGDYCSPGLQAVMPDRCFPHMIIGNPDDNGWHYLRSNIAHNWYVDSRFPTMGFVNRDEAILLYAIARRFAGQRALEIGCWMGWSACHLALGGVFLDVIDPILGEAVHAQSVNDSLAAAGVTGRVGLHAANSPEAVHELAREADSAWSLFFIDGDHEGPAPARDVETCLQFAAADCAFVFHDLASPDVADALRFLEAKGFHTLLYQTQQIIGIAWRGAVTPPAHIPDPKIFWQLPHHLVGFPVSGIEFNGFQANLRSEFNRLGDANTMLKSEIELLRATVAERELEVRRLSGQLAEYWTQSRQSLLSRIRSRLKP